MKKTGKILVAWIATIMVMFSTLWATYAAYWQWTWQWTWMMGQWMTQWAGTMNNMDNYLSNIPIWELNDTETNMILKQYEEEMMANELYSYFYDKYKVITFKNIANSEAMHMASVKAILDRYSLETPTSYDQMQSLYDELKAKWDLSLKDALEVGIKIEMVDIDDIVTAIKATDNDDIKTVLVNIWWASYNHLRGFVMALENNWLTTDIDYSAYLTSEDMSARWSLSYKLIDKLEAAWVELPEWIGSNKTYQRWFNMWKWQLYMNHYSWNNDMMNNRYGNNVWLRNSYRNTYQTKYWNAISKMDDTKLNEFIWKIDDLITKISDGSYNESVKEKYVSMLQALKDLALDSLDESKIFEWLFN